MVRLQDYGAFSSRLVCGTLLHVQSGQSQPGVREQYNANVCLPCAPGGLETIVAAAMPVGFQQLHTGVHQLPCSQIWRTQAQQAQRVVMDLSLRKSGGRSDAEARHGQSETWASFSWASEQLPPQLRTASAANTASLRTAANGNSAHTAVSDVRQPEESFLPACSGSAADWAAAHGGIWTVHTHRHLLRCALAVLVSEC